MQEPHRQKERHALQGRAALVNSLPGTTSFVRAQLQPGRKAGRHNEISAGGLSEIDPPHWLRSW